MRTTTRGKIHSYAFDIFGPFMLELYGDLYTTFDHHNVLDGIIKTMQRDV